MVDALYCGAVCKCVKGGSHQRHVGIEGPTGLERFGGRRDRLFGKEEESMQDSKTVTGNVRTGGLIVT